jgi:enoyl-CoA hydratase/carnithine racemase
MSPVSVERDGPVAVVTLDRTDVHNALDHDTVRALSATLDEQARNPAVRVLVLCGAGDKAFCAGADMRQLAAASDDDLRTILADTRRLFRILANLAHPTIAAVAGLAHGGGAEIACACDLRIAGSRATFRFPGVAYGMAVGTWHLPTVVGLPKAKELLFTAAEIDAAEALRIGLVNRLVADGEVLARACGLAREIAAHPPEAVSSIKSLLNGGVGTPLQQRFFRELYSNQERKVHERVRVHFRRFAERDREETPS